MTSGAPARAQDGGPTRYGHRSALHDHRGAPRLRTYTPCGSLPHGIRRARHPGTPGGLAPYDRRGAPRPDQVPSRSPTPGCPASSSRLGSNKGATASTRWNPGD
ncbi:hypothetical protein GCM10023083_77310 [Streptomyces phyllanthi]